MMRFLFMYKMIFLQILNSSRIEEHHTSPAICETFLLWKYLEKLISGPCSLQQRKYNILKLLIAIDCKEGFRSQCSSKFQLIRKLKETSLVDDSDDTFL